MKSIRSLSNEGFSSKYRKLVKPMFEANLAHMYTLLENPEIQSIIKEARKKLNIPKNGRKPNTEKSFYQKISLLKIPENSIIGYTTSLDEREILKEYIDKIVSGFDIYENFKTSIEIYIVHNLVFAPDHNVIIKQKIINDGKSHIPELHFGRMPYGNDHKIAELLLKRNKQINEHLSEKFIKSYRGKKNLKESLKIVKEAKNRTRKSAHETITITNSEIADLVYNDQSRAENVKKTLYRNKKRAFEISSNPRQIK